MHLLLLLLQQALRCCDNDHLTLVVVTHYSLDTSFRTEFNLHIQFFKYVILGEKFGKETKNATHLCVCKAHWMWMYERPHTHHGTSTGSQTAKSSTWPGKAHRNALEAGVTSHNKSCCSRTALHDSTLDAASGGDRWQNDTATCALASCSTVKPAAVPRASWASGATQLGARGRHKTSTEGLQKGLQQQKDPVASHYIVGSGQIAKMQVKTTIFVVTWSIVFIGGIGLYHIAD